MKLLVDMLGSLGLVSAFCGQTEVVFLCVCELTDGDEWEADTFVTEAKQPERAEDTLQAHEKQTTDQSTALSAVREEPTEGLPHHCK